MEWEQKGERGVEYDESLIKLVDVKAPIQRNSFDCGIFVLKYAQTILATLAPLLDKSPSDDSDASEQLALTKLIDAASFTTAEVGGRRKEILKEIYHDTRAYEEATTKPS